MANQMRWRYGDTAPIMAPVAEATVIEIGDLLYYDSGTAKAAGSQTDTGTKAGNQEAFHDKFLGVALQRSRAGDINPIRVATRGTFEFDCTSNSYELGQLVGVAENSAGNALLNQQLETVSTAPLAVGRCTRREAAGSTTLFVEIVSTVLHGGPAVPA